MYFLLIIFFHLGVQLPVRLLFASYFKHLQLLHLRMYSEKEKKKEDVPPPHLITEKPPLSIAAFTATSLYNDL